MAWVCRLCGGKLRIKVTKKCSDTHNIDKDGTPSKNPSRRDPTYKILKTNIFCKKCAVDYETNTKIETAGVWKE